VADQATTSTGVPAGLPPEVIEKLRTIGLRIDRSGRMWHQGEEVAHPRLRQAILRWLDVGPDGRDIVRLDDVRYAYVDVEDAHLRATSAHWDGDRAFLRLDDGSDEELAYDTLVAAADDAAYCQVRGGRLRARITTPAYYTLAERFVETAGGFAIEAAGSLHAIRRQTSVSDNASAPIDKL
jgi:hypothetical protein